jgi:hypothetical protein
MAELKPEINKVKEQLRKLEGKVKAPIRRVIRSVHKVRQENQAQSRPVPKVLLWLGKWSERLPDAFENGTGDA